MLVVLKETKKRDDWNSRVAYRAGFKPSQLQCDVGTKEVKKKRRTGRLWMMIVSRQKTKNNNDGYNTVVRKRLYLCEHFCLFIFLVDPLFSQNATFPSSRDSVHISQLVPPQHPGQSERHQKTTPHCCFMSSTKEQLLEMSYDTRSCDDFFFYSKNSPTTVE